MNICVISTASLKTRPDKYGGMELEAYWLVKGLEELGHRVGLIAKRGSYYPNGGLIEIDDEKEIPSKCDGIGPDVVIDFSHDKRFSEAYPDFPQLSNYQVMSKTGAGICPVLISEGQKVGKFGGADYPVIHQHLDLLEYPLWTGHRDNYLLTMAQIIPEKRITWSMEVAVRTGVPVHIFGPRWTPADYSKILENYIAEYPGLIYLDDDIGGSEKLQWLQRARCLVHFPGALDFVEAGSIITLEALAVGTVPIVSRNGVHGEYIQHGVNGFIVDSVEEAVAIIKSGAVEKINPEVCRKSVEWADYHNMAGAYVALAERVIAGERW